MVSKGEDAAWDLIAKCKYIYNHIKDVPVPKIGHDNRDKIDFPTNYSEIIALPSTEDAGRSTDATIVIRDEVEFHAYAEVNYSAIHPTVDRGGKIIQVSTIHPYRSNTHFQNLYKDIKGGVKNGKAIFMSWRNRPLDDEDIEKWGTLDNFRKSYLEKTYSSAQLAKEYSENEDEAFSSVSTSRYFDENALSDMEIDTIVKSLEHPLSQKYNDIVKIYKLPIVGRRYICFCDPSDGKEDPHSIVVMDWQTQEEVASSCAKVPVEWVANIFNELVRLYNNAFNSFGLTGFAGGAFSKCIENLNIPNQYRQIKERVGMWESSKDWKETLIMLEVAIRNRTIRVHTNEAIKQFKSMVKPSSTNNKEVYPFVPDGHDDFISAWRGVLHIARKLPIGTIQVSSFKYKEST